MTVFVPHYAMSGGTLIALAADEIMMEEHAVLGPVDPLKKPITWVFTYQKGFPLNYTSS